MNAALQPIHRDPIPSVLKWTARGLLVLWAGFWLWFNVASAIGEGGPSWPHWVLAALMLGLPAIGWRKPVVGGVLLVFGGMFAAWYLRNVWAFSLLALPAAATGVLMLLASLAASRRA